MSETSETPTVQTATATEPPPAAPAEVVHVHKIPRVFQFAAWVGIVAGIVFIVAVIFFAGFGLGRHSGHGGGFHHGHHMQHAMMFHHHQGGPGGPGAGGPAWVTPGAPGPGQIPPSAAPSRTATP